MPERRAQLIKERLEVLRARKAEGKITETEQKALDRLEALEKQIEERQAAEKAAEKPADKPADKPTDEPAQKAGPAKS